MEEILNSTEEKMMLTIESLENKFTNVRAGRANPNMLDGIMVEYYGVPTPLKSLANISIPEARQLSIKPFDRSCLGAIEKAIFEANLGVTPNNNGEVVFIVIPPLTEDRRKELVKQVKGLGEEAKIALRNIRQDANKALENQKLPEDEEKRGNERVQDLINEYNKSMRKIFIYAMWGFVFICIAAVAIVFTAIAKGKIGYVPPVEELENPNLKFATQVISEDGKLLGTWKSEAKRS